MSRKKRTYWCTTYVGKPKLNTTIYENQAEHNDVEVLYCELQFDYSAAETVQRFAESYWAEPREIEGLEYPINGLPEGRFRLKDGTCSYLVYFEHHRGMPPVWNIIIEPSESKT